MFGNWCSRFGRTAQWTGAVFGLALATAAAAQADAPVIRVGHGNAVEEQLWLMKALPEVAPNMGEAYELEFTRFGGADKRFQAFEAGALDIATTSANAALAAASEGIEFKIIGSLSRESERGFYTKFFVLEDSPIKNVSDLKGKTIALNGFRGSAHLWTKIVLEDAGLDPEKDVTLIPVRFPAQGETLRSGKADVATFPQPFAAMEEAEGGVRTLYTSKDAAPFEEELMLLIAKEDYLKENEDAVRAFLADLVNATQFYLNNPDEARKALIESGMVRLDEDVFLGMADYYRDPNLRVDISALEKMQDLQLKAGFQDRPVDIKERVDLSYLPE